MLAQYCPNRRGASVGKLQGQGDQLVIAGLDLIEHQVLQHAQAVRADALVVGTPGRKGLSHFFLGSVAEKLVRRATVPVVCVRSQTAEARSTHEELEADDELPG